MQIHIVGLDTGYASMIPTKGILKLTNIKKYSSFIHRFKGPEVGTMGWESYIAHSPRHSRLPIFYVVVPWRQKTPGLPSKP